MSVDPYPLLVWWEESSFWALAEGEILEVFFYWTFLSSQAAGALVGTHHSWPCYMEHACLYDIPFPCPDSIKYGILWEQLGQVAQIWCEKVFWNSRQTSELISQVRRRISQAKLNNGSKEQGTSKRKGTLYVMVPRRERTWHV